MWFYSLSVQQKTRLALAAVLCLYFLFGSLYATTAPVFEKPDESAHYAYVAYLVEHGRLVPLTWDPLLRSAQAEAVQPPLYYILAAGMTRLIKLNVQSLRLPLNKFVEFPVSAVGNKNVFLHAPNELARPEFWPVYALRFFSLLLVCGTVLCTYGLARELGTTTSFRLLSAALVAVHPQFLFLATSVSND